MPVPRNKTPGPGPNPNPARLQFFIKYWLPVVIYAIIIFSVSSIPGEEIPSVFKYQDVAFHFLEYAFLSVLLGRALKAGGLRAVWAGRFCLILFLCLLYAASDELHQIFVSHRSASIFDIAMDGLGALAANIIYLWRR